MSALCLYLAVVHDDYLVGVCYGGKPVGNNDDGLALNEPCNGVLYNCFIFGVYVGRSLVKYNDG